MPGPICAKGVRRDQSRLSWAAAAVAVNEGKLTLGWQMFFELLLRLRRATVRSSRRGKRSVRPSPAEWSRVRRGREAHIAPTTGGSGLAGACRRL